MRILAVLIYYNGDIDDVINNILTFIPYIDHLIIWMNSPIEDKARVLNNCGDNKISFAGNGKNIGISKALNGALLSIDESYDYLLTMDQDSKWVNFKDYISIIEKNERDTTNVFAYGPSTIVSENDKHLDKQTIVETDQVITSGALVNLKHLETIGGYCEDLWVDGIDEEICFRALSNNFKIIKVNAAYLIQRYGSGKRITIGRHIFIIPEYSANRKYYIVKNHIYLIKKYELDIRTKTNMIIDYIVLPFINTIVFEKDKIVKCKAIMNGIYDGLKWKVN